MGWGMAGEVTQGQRRTGLWQAEWGERGEWATPDRLAAHGTGRGSWRPHNVRDELRGKARLPSPPGQGSDIWTEWENSILPLGSREEPSPIQLCKQEEEEVPSLPLGEGREGW